MRQDLATGRLVSPLSTVCLLSSYAVQSTLGDHDPDSCRPGYLASFAALRNFCKGKFGQPPLKDRVFVMKGEVL